MTIKTKAIMGLGLVAGLGAAVLPLASYADTHDAEAEVQVLVAESITITGIDNLATGLNFTGADISSGEVLEGTHAVTVSTSAVKGYTLTMASDTANLTGITAGAALPGGGGSGANVYGDTTAVFAPIGDGTVVAADPLLAHNVAALTTGNKFATAAPADGKWGYRLDGWTADEFVSVPTTPFTIAASKDAGTEVTTVTFGAQAGTTTPANVYGAWIEYVATTNS